MTTSFDPYHRWLGIPPEEQPPHHYRLLGISDFESDSEVIDSVAQRHIGFLDDISDEAHADAARRLREELETARDCLLDPELKAAYDVDLKSRLDSQLKPPPLMTPPQPPEDPPVIDPVAKPLEDALPITIPEISDTPEIRPVEGREEATSQSCPVIISAERDDHNRLAESASPNRLRMGLIIAGICLALTAIVVVAAMWSGNGKGKSPAEKIDLAGPVEVAKPPVEQTTRSTNHPAQSEEPNPKTDPASGPAKSAIASESTETIEPDAIAGEPVVAESLPKIQPDDVPVAQIEKDREVPSEIPRLLLWLDAADASTMRLDDASRVVEWTDKSAEGFQAEPDKVDTRPQFGNDGKPRVTFSGGQFLAVSGTASPLNLGVQYTIVYVASGTGGCLLSKGSGDSPGSFSFADSTACLKIGGSEFPASDDDGRIDRVRTIVARQNAIQWFVDGKPLAEHMDADVKIETSSVLRIGCIWKRGAGAQECFQGTLSELLIFDRALDDAERSQLEQYLTEKWFAAENPPLLAAYDQPTEVSRQSSDATDADSQTQGSDDPFLSRFVPLVPSQMDATGETSFQLQDDGSVLTDGATRDGDEYRLVFSTPPKTITAFRFEMLPHESLPSNGPGWGQAGCFSLAEIQARFIPLDTSLAGESIRLYFLVAEDQEQARRIIDRDEQTSWTVNQHGKPLDLTIFPSAPLTTPSEHQLVITLVQRENIGCFRISATSAKNPLAILEPVKEEQTEEADTETAPEVTEDDGFRLLVNFAGDSYKDSLGNTWQKSKDFDGKTFGHENGSSAGKGDTQYPMQPWAETALRGLTAFRAVVEDGVYEVTFCFCEQWTRDADRRRFFAVIERGTPHAITRPFYGPGIGRPWTHTVPGVIVKDGRLDIDFRPVDEHSLAILNAIVIREVKPK